MIEFVFSLILVFCAAKELELQQYAFLTSNSFSDSEGWLCNKGVKITDCGSYHLLGGYNMFSQQASVSKSIANLLHHEKLRVKALIMNIKTTEYTLRIDSWDNEFIQLWADGVKVFEKSFYIPDGYQICGWVNEWPEIPATSNELAYQLDVTFPHTASTVYLEFKDTLDQTPEDESWGIRDIKISIVFNCPSECDQVSCQLKYT